jgi:hypothetical protein
MTLAMGEIQNTDTSGTDAETIVLTYTVVVANTTATNNGNQKNNTATFS